MLMAMTAPSEKPAAAPEASAEPADDPWLGRVLDDRYRVIERLAEGGMGVVYVAEHLLLHKEVALKLVAQEANANVDHARRFVREALVTSRIDHPNVISALDFGSFEDGTAYFAMNLARGPTLSSVIEAEGRLTWLHAAEIGAQIADALSAAHAVGIVHRDLKPENVILQRLEDGGELIKLLDFGIAKFARDSLAPPAMHGTQAVTRIGVVIGTPGYMSPEQAVGKRADHRSDLYGLGVLLWECTVGRRLWEHNDMQKLLAAQLNHAPPSVRDESADLTIPVAFDALVAQLLSTQADERPQNAAEVRDLLRRLVADAKAGALELPPQPLARAAGTPTVVLPAPPPPAGPTRMLRPGRPVPHAQSDTGGNAQTEPAARAAAEAEAAAEARVPAAAADTGAAAALDAARQALRATHKLLLSAAARVRAWPRARRAGAAALAAIALAALLALGLRLHRAAPPPDAGQQAQHARPKRDPSALTGPVRQLVRTLVEGESREQRVGGAEALLTHVPVDEVPGYVRLMARLQMAETCWQKQALLGAFRELDDPRTLPALVTLAQRKPYGCGAHGRADCLGCMRDELVALVDHLEAEQIERARTPAAR